MIKRILDFLRLVKNGPRLAFLIKHSNKIDLPVFAILHGMMKCHFLYGLSASDYMSNELWNFSSKELKNFCDKFCAKRDALLQLKREYYLERRFLAKWTKLSYDRTAKGIGRRIQAYRKRYQIGTGAWIEYGVMLTHEYNATGDLKIGEHVLLARNSDLDYTGGLVVGDNVKIMEGVKILTHAHDVFQWKADAKLIPFTNRAYRTPLKIGHNAQIGAHAIIMPGVGEIGDNSMISAGAVVVKRVPSHTIVAGNPAKIVAELPEEVELKADFLI